MSKQTIGANTGNQLVVHTDRTKTFIWNNRYEQADYTAGGSPVVLTEGMLMGRIAATRKVVPLASAATDGSQFPYGILKEDYSLLASETRTLTICVAGDVAEEKVILNGADTMDTIISLRTIRDRIATDTLGIKLVKSTQLTAYDN